MPRALYLHIGSHKTGTTSLQQSLSRHGPGLAAQGAAYVSTPGAPHLHAHLRPIHPEALLPEGFGLHDPQGLADLLAQAPAEKVIASSENFSYLFHEAPIAALHQALAPRFARIVIIAYLRRQDAHAVSHHQEGAKPHRRTEAALWGHAPTALPQVAPHQALYLDYDRRLGLWADVFGDKAMILRPYRRELFPGGDVTADLLCQIGLDPSGLAQLSPRNVSLGKNQAQAGHLLHRLGINSLQAPPVLARLAPGPRLMPSLAEAEAFLAPYRAGNRRLNARFGLSERPEIFADPAKDWPAESDQAPDPDLPGQLLRAAFAQIEALARAPKVLTPDELMAAAQALKLERPRLALRLVKAASLLRPPGEAMQALIAELQAQLSPPSAQGGAAGAAAGEGPGQAAGQA